TSSLSPTSRQATRLALTKPGRCSAQLTMRCGCAKAATSHGRAQCSRKGRSAAEGGIAVSAITASRQVIRLHDGSAGMLGKIGLDLVDGAQAFARQHGARIALCDDA